MVWRHFETLFFTFCAFAARGPHDTWRIDKLRFREVCTNPNPGLLNPDPHPHPKLDPNPNPPKRHPNRRTNHPHHSTFTLTLTLTLTLTFTLTLTITITITITLIRSAPPAACSARR
jgi:hypothetical protein